MKGKATIYDLWRMCNSYSDGCIGCPLQDKPCGFSCSSIKDINYENSIILERRKRHPIITRQDKFLKKYPNAKTDRDGILKILPCDIDEDIKCDGQRNGCDSCREEYWLTEVES